MALPVIGSKAEPPREPLPQGQALVDGIRRLKKERNAVLLAHYYQEGEIQELADFVGDSPDLSRTSASATGGEMVIWQGACLVHEVFTDRAITMLLQQHPGAEVIAHPECEDAVLEHATFVGSTSRLIEYARETKAKTLIVATEAGILHPMQK